MTIAVMDVSNALWAFVDRVLDIDERHFADESCPATMHQRWSDDDDDDSDIEYVRSTLEYHTLYEATSQRAVLLMSHAAVWPLGEVDGWRHALSSDDPEMHGSVRYDDSSETYVFDDIDALFLRLREMYEHAGRTTSHYRALHDRLTRTSHLIHVFVERENENENEMESESA
jgi:hypothetical protein